MKRLYEGLQKRWLRYWGGKRLMTAATSMALLGVAGLGGTDRGVNGMEDVKVVDRIWGSGEWGSGFGAISCSGFVLACVSSDGVGET